MLPLCSDNEHYSNDISKRNALWSTFTSLVSIYVIIIDLIIPTKRHTPPPPPILCTTDGGDSDNVRL